jgi:hypothetical protein
MSDSITLEPPNPAWVQRFEEEKTRLLVASPASFQGLEHFFINPQEERTTSFLWKILWP